MAIIITPQIIVREIRNTENIDDAKIERTFVPPRPPSASKVHINSDPFMYFASINPQFGGE